MWELVIIPILMLAIGFLVGVMVGDGASTNMQIEDLRKKQRKLERQIMRMQNHE